MTPAEEAIYKATINHYGADHQLGIIQEELAELIVAISHYRRERTGCLPVIREVADVMIVVAQLRVILDSEEALDKATREKLARLLARISRDPVKG